MSKDASLASHINMAISWGQFPIELEKVAHFPIFEGNIYSFFPPHLQKRAFTCFKCIFT